MDSCSTDRTAEISKRFGRVIVADSGATRARLIGTEASTGDYVLNLDSDQFLMSHAIEAALATERAAVAFGEVSTGDSLIARINRLDKATVNQEWQTNLDPISGFIRPRLYRRDVLMEAFRSIPEKILDVKPCPFSDDSLVYWHSGVKPDQVGFVPDGIVHEEMAHVLDYVRKWRVYGRTAKVYRGTQYSVFVTSRGKRNVRGMRHFASMPGLAFRVVPFIIGYYL